METDSPRDGGLVWTTRDPGRGGPPWLRPVFPPPPSTLPSRTVAVALREVARQHLALVGAVQPSPSSRRRQTRSPVSPAVMGLRRHPMPPPAEGPRRGWPGEISGGGCVAGTRARCPWIRAPERPE